MGSLPIMLTKDADFTDLRAAHKAIVDGLHWGLSFSEKLPIFCSTFGVALDEFQKFRGPSRDALEQWRNGNVVPGGKKFNSLYPSSKNVLMKRGFEAGVAAQAGQWLTRSSPPKKKAPKVTESKPEEHPKPLQAESSSQAPDGPLDGTLREHWQLLSNDLHARLRESNQAKAQAGEIERLRHEGNETKLRTRLVRELKMAGRLPEFREALLAGQPPEDKSPGLHFSDPEANAALESGFLRGIRLLPNSSEYLDLSQDSIQKLKWELS